MQYQSPENSLNSFCFIAPNLLTHQVCNRNIISLSFYEMQGSWKIDLLISVYLAASPGLEPGHLYSQKNVLASGLLPKKNSYKMPQWLVKQGVLYRGYWLAASALAGAWPGLHPRPPESGAQRGGPRNLAAPSFSDASGAHSGLRSTVLGHTVNEASLPGLGLLLWHLLTAQFWEIYLFWASVSSAAMPEVCLWTPSFQYIESK